MLSLRAHPVTFELNARLDLRGKATTKSLGSLGTELMLQVLGERTWTVRIWVICGDEGVGDIPGVRGVSGGACRFCAMILDWHKNSDLRSEVGTSTSLNTAMHC